MSKRDDSLNIYIVNWSYSSFLLVFVETSTGFNPMTSCINIIGQQWAWTVFWVPEISVQNFHDEQTGIKSDEVRKGKGSHRHIGTQFHSFIDVLFGANSFVEGKDGLVDIRHQQSIGDEPGDIFWSWSLFRHLLCKSTLSYLIRLGSLMGLVWGLQGSNDLHKFHDRDGVHEVHADHFVRSGGGIGKLSNWYGWGIAGNDSFRFYQFIELLKDSLLNSQILHDSLDRCDGTSTTKSTLLALNFSISLLKESLCLNSSI